MIKNLLAPSILSADFKCLGQQISEIENAGADYVHIDVMDGHFVPNISIGVPIVKSIRSCSKLVFDVHLMISEPEKYIMPFADAGADIINFHIEAAKEPMKLIEEIKVLGKLPAVTIRPQTDIETVFPFLPHIKMVLIMSVNPGFGGQKLMETSLKKARVLRDYITENQLDVDIEMDGGIYADNLQTVLDSGANVIVAGSAIFAADSISAEVMKFKEILK